MAAENGTVLLVDDDNDLATAVERRLKKRGYYVLHACSGHAGLDCVGRQNFDIMLLDLMLPDMPGERLLDHVREYSNLPVIVISAKSQIDDRIELLRLGADDYLTKPFSLEELSMRVEAVLRRSRVARSMPSTGRNPGDNYSTLVCGDVDLHINSRETFVGGVPVELSATEFRLLRYLMERAGTAVSAEQLIEQVWGYNGYDRHIVEANIHRLRQKIENDPRRPTRLLTARGFGYKFARSNGTA